MNFHIPSAGTAVFILTILLAGLSAHAQQTGTDTERDTLRSYQLGQIVVSASRFEKDPLSVGRNVTVISRAEIEASMEYDLAGLLAKRQSLHLIGGSQTPGSLQQGFLRNADVDQTVVMIDGTPISDPSTVNNAVDLSEISLAGVKRIEIIRGSHSTLYGSSAIGGVINLITRGSQEEGIGLEAETRHGLLSNGAYTTGNTLFGGYTHSGGFYLNLGADQKYTPGLDATVDTSDAGGFASRDRDGFRKLDLTARAGYRSDNLRFHASWRRADQRSEVDQSAFTDDDNAYVNFSRDLFNWSGSLEVTSRFRLEMNGAWSDLSRNFVNDSSRVAPDGSYDGTYTETSGTGTLLDNELLALYQGESLSATAGISSVRQNMNYRTYTFVRPFNFESVTDLDSLDLSENTKSLFLHTEWDGSLLSSELDAFSLVVGGRISRHDRFGSHLTWEINPSMEVGEDGLLYAAATTGYNAPSLYQLYTPEMSFGAYTTRGNEELSPESSISYEVGWKQSVGDFMHLELSLFHRRVDDNIEYVYLWEGEMPVQELTPSDYLGDTYINLARQDIKGLELGMETHLTPQWQVSGNMTYTSSTLEFTPAEIDREYTGGHHVQVFESGLFLDENKSLDGLTRRPSVNAYAEVRFRPSSSLTLTWSGSYTGRRDDIYFSNALGPLGAQDRTSLQPYLVSSLSARYTVTDELTLSGGVNNIFDTQFQEINGYRSRGRGVHLKLSYRM